MSAEEAEPVIAASRPRSIDICEVSQSVKIMMCLMLLSIRQRWCICRWTGLLFTLQTGGGGQQQRHKDGFIRNVSFLQRVRVISVTLLSTLAPGGIRLFPDCLAEHFNFALTIFWSVHNNNINSCVVIYFFKIFSPFIWWISALQHFILNVFKESCCVKSQWKKKNASSHRLVVFRLIKQNLQMNVEGKKLAPDMS